MANVPTTDLIPDQRRELIIQKLLHHQVLSVQQIMEMFSCSHMTVRRDIATLEREGRAISVSGGVRIVGKLSSEPSHQDKAIVDKEAKEAIAALAATYLHDDMTLYLDAGTTTLALVPWLQKLSKITVVTNDFVIVQALIHLPNIEVIHTGGSLDHANQSSVGRLAAATLNQLAIDLAFISTSSWELHRGITTPSAAKVDVKQAAMAAATHTFLLVSSIKYGTYSRYRIASLDKFDVIISDRRLAHDISDQVCKVTNKLELANI